MDRAAQKAGVHYSGIEGIAMQDASLQESMGPIQDRTRENLCPTDRGIVMTRRMLLQAAEANRAGKPHARPRSRGAARALVRDRAAARPALTRTTRGTACSRRSIPIR